MKQYYAERNGLLKDELELSLDELNEALFWIYTYFKKKEYFECAEVGISEVDRWTHDETQIEPASMAPNPQVYIMTKLQNKCVWPIYEYYMNYTEDITFSVIEILYDHIAKYDYTINYKDSDTAKVEFIEQINNILKFYKDGYYLESKNGFIMKLPNEALKEQLTYNGEAIPDTIYEQLQTATKMFYRFDSNLETKKKAINILADILENVREDLKNLLNDEYEINKNEHDKLIFNIVNGFNIRHNNNSQKTDYSKDIWYDWMMQYYTSVIIAYYRLKEQSL